MFHLWPQGRIVRICILALAVMIAVDLGLNGAYASFNVWMDAQDPVAARRQLILGIIYATIGCAALVAGFIAAGPHKRAVQFLIEVEDEMTKVEWPALSQLWRSTLVIAVAIAVLAGIVFLTDLALLGGLEFIQKR
jgi:preprotein translocase SecE subunit